MSESTAKEDVKLDRAELELLCQAANAGDQQARARLTEWLNAEPGVWQSVGDVGKRTELALRNAMTAGDYLQGECLLRSADALRKSLLPEDATPLEELGVQRLIIAWHQLQHAEERLTVLDGTGQARSTFWIKAVDSAHKRFDAAMKQLQSLQKALGRPACRSAIEDVLAGGAVQAGDQKHADGAQQHPVQTSTATEHQRRANSDTESTHSPNVQAMEGTEPNGDTSVPDDSRINLSGILPFRVEKRA